MSKGGKRRWKAVVVEERTVEFRQVRKDKGEKKGGTGNKR